MATDGEQTEALRQWIKQLRRILKLRAGGDSSEEALLKLREEMGVLSSGESPLPPGVHKLLGELAETLGGEPVPEDEGLRETVEALRDDVQRLLERLWPVLQPEETGLQRAWLQLSAQSLELRRYELALKVLQDALQHAKVIEAEQRVVPEQPAQASPLRPVVERALLEVDKLSAQLDPLATDQQVQFLLLASLTQKCMAAGDDLTALGLVSEMYKLAEQAIPEQDRQRSVALRQRIEDEVYIPNAELKTLEAPLAAVPHSDDWFHRDTVAKADWEAALLGVEQDHKTVETAVAQARLACEQARLRWATERATAELALQRLELLTTDKVRDSERQRLAERVAGVDLATLGLQRLGEGCAALQGLAEDWQRAAETADQARVDHGLRKTEVTKRLDRVTLEAPGERGALDLLASAAQVLADQRDWAAAVGQLDECLRIAGEKIAAQRERVKKGLGTNVEADYAERLFDQLGAVGVKNLSDVLGAKTLGALSLQFSVDELVQLQGEAGDGKALKTMLDEVCGGHAADLKSVRAAFGSLAVLQATARQGFDGKLKTVGALLKTGFGGDAGKLKTFLDGYPSPDPDLLKAKNPAAVAAQKDQENLKNLLNQGGLNDNPEVFAHLVSSGCDGDPAKLKALHGQFSATTPPGLAGMKALLDTAGLKLPPERLADILKTGCDGQAVNLKELAVGFDGKMPQLKEITTQWGDDSGMAIKGLVDERHLKGDYQAIQKRFTQTLNADYPGSANRSTREFLIRAAPSFTRKELPDDLNGTLDDPFEPEDAGSFDGTDWNHLLMHVCERHLPESFAFTEGKAAKNPINFNNSQFPDTWTPQDIADLLQAALKSPAGQKAIADSEDYADEAEAWNLRKAWERARDQHDRWTRKNRQYQVFLAHDNWFNKGGKMWLTYQRVLARGEQWSSRRPPPNPGPEPERARYGWDTPPGPKPPAPGVEPPVVAEPVWDPEKFWYGDVRFQIGVDFRDGRRQITQLFPIDSRGVPAMTAFSGNEMATLRDAMVK